MLMALAGFAVVGLGISVMAPLTFAAAGRLDPHETGIAVARLNVFNYVGFLLGAPLLTSLWQAGLPYRPGWATWDYAPRTSSVISLWTSASPALTAHRLIAGGAVE